MKSPHRLTADKREIKACPKSRQGGTSFIRETLGESVTYFIKNSSKGGSNEY